MDSFKSGLSPLNTLPRRISMRTQGKLGVALFLAIVASATAQVSDAAGTRSETRARSDQDWNSLQALVLAGDSRLDSSRETTTREATQAKQRSEFLALAEQARKFQADFPTDERGKAAYLLETRTLLKAALVGDQTQRKRAFEMAEAVKSDRSVTTDVRFDVAFLEQQVLVRSFTSTKEDYLAASAVAARQLISEYRLQNGGYQWLLVTAEDARDDEQLAQVAQEVSKLDVPFRARARAAVIKERLELVGKSLADFANTALGRDNFFEQSRARRTVLYTWSAADPDSIAWATDLEKKIPADTLMIGVCLSTNVATAKAVSHQMGLTALQYYSEGGVGSFLALRLKLSRPGLIFVTDASGTVVTVTAREDNVVSFLRK
jgi:hypothetical protein